MKFRVKISADRRVLRTWSRDPPPPLWKQKNLIRSHDPDFFLRLLAVRFHVHWLHESQSLPVVKLPLQE